jgi:hypothetical protein
MPDLTYLKTSSKENSLCVFGRVLTSKKDYEKSPQTFIVITIMQSFARILWTTDAVRTVPTRNCSRWRMLVGIVGKVIDMVFPSKAQERIHRVLNKIFAHDLTTASMPKEAQYYELAFWKDLKLHTEITQELSQEFEDCECGHPFLFHGFPDDSKLDGKSFCRRCYQTKSPCNSYRPIACRGGKE